MIRVVYIMGAARSGSTVVGVLLGNGEDAFYAGELDVYAREDGRPTNDRAETKRFWARVRHRVECTGVETDAEWHALLEHPRGLLCRRRPGTLSAYRRFATALYEAVATEAEVRTVIDSSHYPLRLWRLRRLPGVELYTIHLVRDPRAVVASLQTDMRPKSRLAANVYLFAVHVLSELIYRTVARERRLRLRYEDVLRNPDECLQVLSDWSGIDVSRVDLGALLTGPAFAGNRIIKHDTVVLRRAAEAAIRETPWTAVAQGVWLRRYGYADPERAVVR